MSARARRFRRVPAPRPALLALAAAALLAGCDWQDQPVTWSFERMIDQRSFRAYEGAALFPDSMVMRHPPSGTVHRAAAIGDAAMLTGRVRPDSFVLVPAATAGPAGPRRERAPFVQRIPLRLGMDDLQRGRDRFGIFCAVCHGIDGQARTPVAGNMSLRPPPSLLREELREAPDGRIFAAITEGYGLMPSYAAELDVLDRWAVVAYVRALQLAQRADLDALPDSVRRAFRAAVPGGGP